MTYANLRPTACAILLLIGVSSATALVLERPRGSVVLGRPLDFNVQVTLSAGEDTASLCLEADVFQADALVNPGRVNVQLLKVANNGLSTLRVSSPTIVDEPVLTVVIRYGCLSKNSRRYVVFADPPASVNESALGFNDASAFDLTPLTQPALKSASHQAVANVARMVAPASRKKATQITSSDLVQSKRLGSSTPAISAKPRLQLDGIESTSEAAVRLKSTLELLVVPSELSSAQRVEAAALWRVIGAQSEDLLQDVQRLTALQAETLALRDASTRSRAEISRLSVQLKEAESSRYLNPLVYGLAAALGLLLVGFAFIRLGLNKSGAKPVWWNPRRDKSEPDDLLNSSELKEPSFPKVLAPQREPVVPLKVSPVIRLADRTEHEAQSTQPKFKSSESAYSILGAQGNARGVNVEELFDIQQQADFFISLGQHDQAIEVLQNHIRENAHTSPLVYLDLLKLYHRQDKRAEYQELTAEFTRLFNAEVPVFDAFKDQTRGLEAYEATLSQIVSFWHSEAVLNLIEDSVFRDAGRSSEALDLEAYRELLLLHSIAKDLSENPVLESDLTDQTVWPKIGMPVAATRIGALSPGNFNQTIPQKLAPTISGPGAETAYSDIRTNTFQKPVGARIGLDIDLTADAPGLAPNRPTVIPEKLKPEESAPTGNSGLIEFDLDSFSISNSKKTPLK